jgi:hypothetical protein
MKGTKSSFKKRDMIFGVEMLIRQEFLNTIEEEVLGACKEHPKASIRTWI